MTCKFGESCSLLSFAGGVLSVAVYLSQVIYLKKTPEEAYRALLSGSNPPYLPFRYSWLLASLGLQLLARRRVTLEWGYCVVSLFYVLWSEMRWQFLLFPFLQSFFLFFSLSSKSKTAFSF